MDFIRRLFYAAEHNAELAKKREEKAEKQRIQSAKYEEEHLKAKAEVDKFLAENKASHMARVVTIRGAVHDSKPFEPSATVWVNTGFPVSHRSTTSEQAARSWAYDAARRGTCVIGNAYIPQGEIAEVLVLKVEGL